MKVLVVVCSTTGDKFVTCKLGCAFTVLNSVVFLKK